MTVLEVIHHFDSPDSVTLRFPAPVLYSHSSPNSSTAHAIVMVADWIVEVIKLTDQYFDILCQIEAAMLMLLDVSVYREEKGNFTPKYQQHQKYSTYLNPSGVSEELWLDNDSVSM